MENEHAKARWKILENTGSGIPKASLMVRSPEFFSEIHIESSILSICTFWEVLSKK
jgi:hypothetical protein